MINARGFIPICGDDVVCVSGAGTGIEAGRPPDRQPARRCLFDLHIGDPISDTAARQACAGKCGGPTRERTGRGLPGNGSSRGREGGTVGSDRSPVADDAGGSERGDSGRGQQHRGDRG